MSKFLVIDGLDGSGKGTVTKMLCQYLQEKGIENNLISFPMYEYDSSIPVKMYLSGKLGANPEDNNAYAASMLYAVDRYISFKTVWKSLYEKENSILIADRYTTSNAVHQLTKLPHEQWDSFLSWLFDFEYEKLELPRPDHVFYLEMPPAICRQLIAKRAAESGRAVDIHEKDSAHLDRAYSSALYAAQTLGWTKIPCHEQGHPRNLNEILMELLEKAGLSVRPDVK